MVVPAGLTYTDALAWLQDATQSAVEPTLSTAELGRLLMRAAQADEDGNLPDRFPAWAASTAYALNYRVVPATRNGYVYIVTTAGTSHSAAPVWPTTDGATVSDGTVTWTNEDTAAWTPTYAAHLLHRPAAEGWRMKAAKLGTGETFTADGASFNPETRRQFCLDMAEQYRKRIVGTAPMTGRTSVTTSLGTSTQIL